MKYLTKSFLYYQQGHKSLKIFLPRYIDLVSITFAEMID